MLTNYETVKKYWSEANSLDQKEQGKRWIVAYLAYKNYRTAAVNRHAVAKFAEQIAAAQGDKPISDKTPTDTVYRLIHAYLLFVELLKQDAKRARQYRRRYTYTRFSTVWLLFQSYEFEPDKLFDYLDYNGGNRALSAFVEHNESTAPEWERRAYSIHKQAMKLKDDYGVPDRLRAAAVAFIEEFSKWENS